MTAPTTPTEKQVPFKEFSFSLAGFMEINLLLDDRYNLTDRRRGKCEKSHIIIRTLRQIDERQKTGENKIILTDSETLLLFCNCSGFPLANFLTVVDNVICAFYRLSGFLRLRETLLSQLEVKWAKKGEIALVATVRLKNTA
jgi:hypothetical protein